MMNPVVPCTLYNSLVSPQILVYVSPGPSYPGEVPGADPRPTGCGAYLRQHGTLRCQVRKQQCSKIFRRRYCWF